MGSFGDCLRTLRSAIRTSLLATCSSSRGQKCTRSILCLAILHLLLSPFLFGTV